MLPSFGRHLFEYFILALCVGIWLWAFIVVEHNRAARMGLVISLFALYVIWGIIHHLLDRDLTTKIIIEYAAIAALASGVLAGLILQV